MTTIRSVLFLALSAVTLSCGGSPDPDTTPPIKASTVEVSIASVTLADDCGTGPTTIPTAPTQIAQARAVDEPAGRSMAKGASMSQAQGDRACEQSSIQLRVENGTTVASTVAIHKIELIDDNGIKVGELTPRAPSRWAADTYQVWDQQVAPSEVLQVSYALSAPSVSRGASYTVRVTIAAGDGERTIEQRTTLEAEASLPPGVVT